MIEDLVRWNYLSQKNVTTCLGLKPPLTGPFEGCVFSFKCLTTWSVEEAGVRLHLQTHGAKVVHLERMERGAYDKGAAQRVRALCQGLRDAHASDEPLPFDVLFPPDSDGAVASSGVLARPPPAVGSQPNRIRRACINVDSNLVDGRIAPPGSLPEWKLCPFLCVCFAVRHQPNSQIPLEVRRWSDPGIGLGTPHSVFKNKTKQAPLHEQLKSGKFDMMAIAGQLFTSKTTKLARLIDFISE